MLHPNQRNSESGFTAKAKRGDGKLRGYDAGNGTNGPPKVSETHRQPP